MFQGILQWLRKVLDKMIKSSSIKSALGVDIEISPPMIEALQKWGLMYINKASWLSEFVKSLNLSAAIAGEISRSATIEMEVDISGSSRADFLAEQFEKVIPRLREQVEYGNAKGGLMLKPYISADEISVDYVQADMFYPISFDSNGNLISVVFSDHKKQGNDWYTRLEYHEFDKALSQYQIRNSAFKSSLQGVLGTEVSLSLVPEWADLEPDTTLENITAPLFGYYRFPLANAIDTTSPLGVSCYSRADGLIEQADIQWSDLVWEFESGKRAIYVDTQAFDKTSDEGKPILRDRRLYREMDRSDAIGQKHSLFDEWSPDFREASYLSGLDAILKRIEFTCGLAYGTLSDPAQIDKTATEIKASKQRSHATIKDTQKALEVALDQLAYAMDVWVSIGSLAPAGTYKIAYFFDDSIVTDRDTQIAQDRLDVIARNLAPWEFRVRNYGEDEATARKMVAEIQADQKVELFNE